MASDSVWVLTSKSIKTMFKEGGSGNWRAYRDRLERAEYLVAIRNQHSTWTQGEEEHGTAFLIGRISGVALSPSEPGRYVIQFDKYALISIPNVWPKRYRNPVAYKPIGELGIDPNTLDWLDFPNTERAPTQQGTVADQKASALFDKAKELIATALSISPEAVQITITL